MVKITIVNSLGKIVTLSTRDEYKARKFARALAAKGIKIVSFSRC